MMVTAPNEISDQFSVREAVGVDGLNLPVGGDRRGLAILVPVAELLAPELLVVDLLGSFEALRYLRLGRKRETVVGEPVDVGDFHAAQQHPVVAGEIARTLFKGLRMGLGKVASHRTREVHGILGPRAGAWGLEQEFPRGSAP